MIEFFNRFNLSHSGWQQEGSHQHRDVAEAPGQDEGGLVRLLRLPGHLFFSDLVDVDVVCLVVLDLSLCSIVTIVVFRGFSYSI